MNKDYQTMYDFLKDDIANEIKENFYFVLTKTEVQTIIVGTISKLLQRNETDKTVILNQISINLHQKINEIHKDEAKVYEVLEKFINQNLKNRKYPEAIMELEKLISFVNDLEIFYTVDLNIKMLEQNKVLYNLVETIFKQNQEKFLSSDDSQLFSDELGDLIVRGYCFFNEIDLNEAIDEEFLKLKNSDSYTSDDLKMYFREIAAIPLLTAEEEYQLGLRILQNDEEAQQLLVKHNLKLSVHVARRFVGNGLDLLDLIQEGNMGLMKAAQKFDVTKGYRFSTYAFNWIEQFVRRSLADQGKIIRQPVHFYEKLKSFKRAKTELSLSLNREPTTEELIAKTGFTKKEINDLLYYNREIISYNTLIDDEDDELEIFLADDKAIPEDIALARTSRVEFHKILEKVNLNSKELDIIMLRNGFVDGEIWTLERIAKKYNVTRERIRQIEAKALSKIKRNKDFRQMFNEQFKMSGPRVTLYDLLKTNSTEAIKQALEKLYPEELAIIENNFDSKYQLKTSEFGDKEIFQKNILPVLKKLVENPNYQHSKPKWANKVSKTLEIRKSNANLYDLLNTTPEQLAVIIPKLYPEEYFLILKRFGPDFRTVNTNVTIFEKEIIYTSIYKTLKRFLKKPTMNHYLPNWIVDLRKDDTFLKESIDYLRKNNFSSEEIECIFPNAQMILNDYQLKRIH